MTLLRLECTVHLARVMSADRAGACYNHVHHADTYATERVTDAPHKVAFLVPDCPEYMLHLAASRNNCCILLLLRFGMFCLSSPAFFHDKHLYSFLSKRCLFGFTFVGGIA